VPPSSPRRPRTSLHSSSAQGSARRGESAGEPDVRTSSPARRIRELQRARGSHSTVHRGRRRSPGATRISRIRHRLPALCGHRAAAAEARTFGHSVPRPRKFTPRAGPLWILTQRCVRPSQHYRRATFTLLRLLPQRPLCVGRTRSHPMSLVASPTPRASSAIVINVARAVHAAPKMKRSARASPRLTFVIYAPCRSDATTRLTPVRSANRRRLAPGRRIIATTACRARGLCVIPSCTSAAASMFLHTRGHGRMRSRRRVRMLGHARAAAARRARALRSAALRNAK
jgi:hypothetical protein